MITKTSIVEIQNLVVNPKSRPVMSNSEQYKFLFKYTFNKKLMTKIFQNKEKTLFWGHFCPKIIFPKNSGLVQLQAPQYLNVKDTE